MEKEEGTAFHVSVSHMFCMIDIALAFSPFSAIDVAVLDAASIRITARSPL